MQKIVFSKDEINSYIDKLSSLNNGIIKLAAQKLAEESSHGRVVLSSFQNTIIKILNGIIENPLHQTIYKWIYKCLCFYSDKESEKILLKNFLLEQDSESRVWIISAISSRYNDEEALMKVLKPLKLKTNAPELENDKLFFATSLFSNLPIKKVSYNLPDAIVQNNDDYGMMWLTKVYAFPDQAKQRGLGNLVNDEIISSITYSSNKELQLYAHWSLVSHNSYHLLSMDDIKEKNLSTEVLKWYFNGIIIGQNAQRNYDYICSTIYMCIYNYRHLLRAKQGVINALLSIEYNHFYDKAIIKWFYNETYDEIKISLIEYLVKNVQGNNEAEAQSYGSYFEILKDEYDNYHYKNYIYNNIMIYKTLQLKNDTIEIIIAGEKKGDTEMLNQTIIIGSEIGDKNQIGGKNNTLILENEQNRLKELLDDFIKVCPDDDLCAECKNVRDNISKAINSKEKILNLVSHIASWLTIATSTPTVVNAAKEVVNYLTTIF